MDADLCRFKAQRTRAEHWDCIVHSFGRNELCIVQLQEARDEIDGWDCIACILGGLIEGLLLEWDIFRIWLSVALVR